MTDDTQHDYPVIPQHVTGERLVIRPTTRADGPYLQKWWNDPAVMEQSGSPDGMQYDREDMEQWFQRNVDGHPYAHHFIICQHTPRERPIGEFYIACDDRPGCISFALLIGEADLWGQGYLREAILAYAEALFATSTCGAMRLEVPLNNARALRVYESLGFQVETVWANGRCQTMILTQAAYELRKFREQEQRESQTQTQSA